MSLYKSLLSEPHLLIAGATGSGKSVLENGLIFHLMEKQPNEFSGGIQLILIDPKRVELVQYRNLPHTIQYASEPEDMVDALRLAMKIIEDRYESMQRRGQRLYSGGDVYVFIDELADLMTTQGKLVQPLIQRIAQIGRAAKVHLVCCTQCPKADIIPTPIKVNFEARIGLRTSCAQDSRNILDMKGCERLPRYGQGYYMNAEGVQLYDIPMYSDEQIMERVNGWMHWKETLPKYLPDSILEIDKKFDDLERRGKERREKYNKIFQEIDQRKAQQIAQAKKFKKDKKIWRDFFKTMFA